MFALVTTVICPLNRMPLRLFRHTDTGEGVVIGGEMALLMGYGSLSRVLRNSPDCSENIHFFTLSGPTLCVFKHYLSTQNIPHYRRVNRLFLISETGAAFLLGRNCKEQAVRVGEWLMSEVFPLLRSHLPLAAYQKIASLYLNCEFYVLLWHGRFGIMFSDIFELLAVPPLDHVSRALHGYVANLHMDSWLEPSAEGNGGQAGANLLTRKEAFLFYQTGLYRYWNCLRHPMFSLMRLCFEREVWPQCRGGEWLPFREIEAHNTRPETVEPPTTQPAVVCAMEPVPDYPDDPARHEAAWQKLHTEISRETAPLTELLRRVENGLNDFAHKASHMLQQHEEQLQTIAGEHEKLAQELREQNLRLLARLDGLRDICSEQPLADFSPAVAATPPGAPQESANKEGTTAVTLASLKELAQTLQLYYLDRQTPHLVFARALITHARSQNLHILRHVLTENMKLQPGENHIELGGTSYRVWRG